MNAIVKAAKNMTADIKVRHDRIVGRTKVVLVLIAGLVLVPIGWFSALGFAGAAIALALGLGLVNLAPVLAMKFANWKLRAITAEARTNPVETMRAVYLQRAEELKARLTSISQFETAVLNYADKVKLFRSQYPEDAPKFEAQLQTNRVSLERRQQAYTLAKGELKEYERLIEKADAIWQMAQETIALTAASGGSVEDEFMKKLKSDTALDAITSRVNESFAALNSLELAEGTSATRLQHQPGEIIDVEVQPIKSAGPIPRKS